VLGKILDEQPKAFFFLHDNTKAQVVDLRLHDRTHQ
jgi:hypothetical protein